MGTEGKSFGLRVWQSKAPLEFQHPVKPKRRNPIRWALYVIGFGE